MVFLQFFDTLGAKNTVNIVVLGFPGAKIIGIYKVFFASGSKSNGIYSVLCLGSSKNTGIYAVFSVLEDVVSICGKRKNTVFTVFFALGQTKTLVFTQFSPGCKI